MALPGRRLVMSQPAPAYSKAAPAKTASKPSHPAIGSALSPSTVSAAASTSSVNPVSNQDSSRAQRRPSIAVAGPGRTGLCHDLALGFTGTTPSALPGPECVHATSAALRKRYGLPLTARESQPHPDPPKSMRKYIAPEDSARRDHRRSNKQSGHNRRHAITDLNQVSPWVISCLARRFYAETDAPAHHPLIGMCVAPWRR
jgi:hypothetical protein